MTPQFKFTMSDDVINPGGIVVPQPIGWKDAKLTLERDKSFHSLIEYFKGTFIWYSTALLYLQQVKETQGPDAIVKLNIDISFGSVFEYFFSGLVDLSLMEELSQAANVYKCTAPIIRNDLWAKFISRKAHPVNLQAAIDLDGGARTPINKISLPLTGQKIRRGYSGELTNAIVIKNPIAYPNYFQLGMSNELLTEINDFFTLPSVISSSLPVSMFTLKEAGTYVFDLRIEASWVHWVVDDIPAPCTAHYRIDNPFGKITFFVKINDASPVAFFATNVGSPTFSTVYTFNSTFNLNVGDTIRIYGVILTAFGQGENLWVYGKVNTDVVESLVGLMSGGFCVPYTANVTVTIPPPSAATLPTYFKITADTTFSDSVVDAYLLKDAFQSVLTKLVGADNVLTSAKLSGCAGLNATMKGKHLRGYTFTEKGLTLSFDDLWGGWQPILNLGLGYNSTGIEIEGLESFYNPAPSVTIKNVPNIVKSSDLNKYFKSVEIGYTNSYGNIDDPQTAHTYLTKFKTIGVDLKILSKAVLGSLAIELTRRNGKDSATNSRVDTKLDEENFGIALNNAGGYRPEIGSDFVAVTGLLNSAGRYNIRHTPGRIFNRWKKWIAGCLQLSPTGYFKFNKGSGNYTMSSQVAANDCDAQTPTDPAFFENQDIVIGTKSVMIPEIYKAKFPMTWTTYKLIRAARKQAIAISTGNKDFSLMFIESLEYPVYSGYANFVGLLGSRTKINP